MIFEKYVCDIIQTEMGLGPDQVYLWDQKINEPNNEKLYIAVAVLSCKPFGNSRKYVGNDANMVQVQSVNMSSNLSIDIMSRGIAARDQKEQVLLALNSDYAEAVQEKFSFNIATLSNSFINLTKIEGSGLLYRFNISVRIQYFITKTSPVLYYDTFLPDTVSANN